MPRRIQLSRAKGYRKPEGAVVVARPTKWGNPYAVGDTRYCFGFRFGYGEQVTDRETAVRFFREMLAYERRTYPSTADIRCELAGKDLACWCPLGEPCHADVLLEIANA